MFAVFYAYFAYHELRSPKSSQVERDVKEIKKPDARQDIKPESKPEIRQDKKPEIKPDIRQSQKPEIQPQFKPEVWPEIKPAPKPEIKPEIKPQPKPEIKPEIKPQPKPEIKPQPKPEIKPEFKPQPKPEIKPEIKPQPKPEIKPEIKPQPKPEIKPEIKQDPKPEFKPKFDVKPQPKEPEKVYLPVYESDSEEELSDVSIDEEDLEGIEDGDDDDFIPIMVSKAAKMVDAATLDKLEAGFKKLEESDSKSLLKKYLTKDVFEKLKNLKTPSFGSTLLDCIQSGVENLDSGVGIYAPDAESYSVFAELFDPIIEDYHQGFKKSDKHPAKDWGDVDSLGNLDPTGEYVISTRVRCGRSMEGYPFNPCLTEAQYKEMEEKVSSTLSSMAGELKGTYYPLTGMTKETQQKLIDDHFLFKEGDRFLQHANACRFWPSGRGIYHNDNKTFLVWCNEEDHLRIISMQMGGDLGQVYRRLVTAVNDVEKKVPFSHNDRLGFLTFCPTNLGTTVRASVHIKVPKLAANKEKLEEVAGKFSLQVRGTRGEHTEAEGGVYDISNKRRMGLTEYQAVKEMHDGILEIIKMEKEL